MAQSFIRFTGLPQFEKDLATLAQRLDLSLADIIDQVGFGIFAGVTERTPVDTGYARANWLISTRSINNKVISKAGYPAGKDNSAKAEARNAKMLSSVNPDPKRSQMFITNSVPYIVFLEQGKTLQMDKGYMVQRTLATVAKNIADEVEINL